MLEYEQIAQTLEAEFAKLCLRFNVDTEYCHFNLVSDKMILYTQYLRLWKLQGVSTADEFAKELLDSDLYPGTLMLNQIFCVFKNGKLDQWAFIPLASMWEFLYKYKGALTDEELMDYLKQSVRHEVGHMIANQKLFDDYGIEAGGDMFRQLKDDQDKIWYDYLDKHPSDDLETEEQVRDYYTTYYTLPYEKAANDAAGLTIEEMVKTEVTLWRRKTNYENNENQNS